MGHDLIAFDIDFESPDDEPNPAKLRMTSEKGRRSPLYNILEAQDCNAGDSGTGEIKAYPDGIRWPPANWLWESLSPPERQFLQTIKSRFTRGFKVFFT